MNMGVGEKGKVGVIGWDIPVTGKRVEMGGVEGGG